MCPFLPPQKRDDRLFQGAAEGGGGGNEDLGPCSHQRTLNSLCPPSASLGWPPCFCYLGRKNMWLPCLPWSLVAMETPIPHTWFTYHAWLSPDRGHRLAFALCFSFLCLPGAEKWVGRDGRVGSVVWEKAVSGVDAWGFSEDNPVEGRAEQMEKSVSF